MTRDKHGQTFLVDFLRAYAATPGQETAGNLPGGGALFADCTRAAEVLPEQLALAELTEAERESLLVRGEGDE